MKNYGKFYFSKAEYLLLLKASNLYFIFPPFCAVNFTDKLFYPDFSIIFSLHLTLN